MTFLIIQENTVRLGVAALKGNLINWKVYKYKQVDL